MYVFYDYRQYQPHVLSINKTVMRTMAVSVYVYHYFNTKGNAIYEPNSVSMSESKVYVRFYYQSLQFGLHIKYPPTSLFVVYP